MLERIEDVQGIGLLHQVKCKQYAYQKATLIYAENGRGKSTLATIFRSVSTGNGSLIDAYKTVDGTLPPKVVLQFGNGHKVSFENGVWSEKRPEILVFDADFIGRNVHSGGLVSTDHRKNLLEFALGEAAVVARAAVDKATGDSKTAAEKAQEIVSQLSAYHEGLTLAQFEQLPQVSDIDTKIAELNKQIIAANNVATIQAKAVPKVLAEPSFDIDGLFDGLALSLKDVHANAEKTVKQHISKLGSKGAENWLNQGQQFVSASSCPFCDQDISTNDLVRAYQTHFNAAYADMKNKVAALQNIVATDTADSILERLSNNVGIAVAQAAAWAEHVPMPPISFDASIAKTDLEVFRNFVTDLTNRKQAAPGESLGSPEDKAKATSLWKRFLLTVQAANADIKITEELVSSYKAQLSSDNVVQLQKQIQQLQSTKRRHEPAIVALLAQRSTAQASAEAAEKTKKSAREKLDALMKATLEKYTTSINALLKNFGASFSINGMSANFRGNAPRTEYGLLLRGKDVVLEGGQPSFSTALSEGDKRTLAFAFFIASALADPKLSSRTVVIDDPMCSLDLNRRHHTRATLKKLHSKSAQLIVLAHDPYFLRDLRDTFRKEDKSAIVTIIQLMVTHGNYTDFASLDIDMECESKYSRHHRLLNEFSLGNGGDPRSVANAIRPLLEGYLHRRFPGLLPKDLLFGKVVTLIRDSVEDSPLSHARNLVDELNEINDYAGQFHHNTNTDRADSIAVTASELKTYVDRALTIIYKGTP